MGQSESLQKILSHNGSVHEDQICAPCSSHGANEACEEDKKAQLKLKKSHQVQFSVEKALTIKEVEMLSLLPTNF
jgi:hypothetical protein